MNINPPNDVGICAAFSVSNCGNSVPKPSAIPQSAIVIIAIVITDTANMKSLTCSSQSVTTDDPQREHEQRRRADPELRPQQLRAPASGSTAAARACVPRG